MSAIRAFSGMGYLIEPGPVLSLSRPSPRVLAAICKENVSACDVIATVSARCLLHSWKYAHVKSFENTFTVCLPEIYALQKRAHRVERAWSLEATKLSAYLIHPLSHVVIEIDLCVKKLAAWSCIIQFRLIVIVELSVKLNQCGKCFLTTQALSCPLLY